jgi:hypothetical protein
VRLVSWAVCRYEAGFEMKEPREYRNYEQCFQEYEESQIAAISLFVAVSTPLHHFHKFLWQLDE